MSGEAGAGSGLQFPRPGSSVLPSSGMSQTQQTGCQNPGGTWLWLELWFGSRPQSFVASHVDFSSFFCSLYPLLLLHVDISLRVPPEGVLWVLMHLINICVPLPRLLWQRVHHWLAHPGQWSTRETRLRLKDTKFLTPIFWSGWFCVCVCVYVLIFSSSAFLPLFVFA
jgi:hypothetical protein